MPPRGCGSRCRPPPTIGSRPTWHRPLTWLAAGCANSTPPETTSSTTKERSTTAPTANGCATTRSPTWRCPTAPLDYSSLGERRLILAAPPYLTPRWHSDNWRIYAVRDPDPIVAPLGPSAAQTLWVGRQGFGLDVSHPGEFLVRVNFTPYWSISRGAGCVKRRGAWTQVRADHAGILRVSAEFSLGSALTALGGEASSC